ncbi:MAG TPA: hypothetical protein VF469_26710 [Kofleriaceae bacterium]
MSIRLAAVRVSTIVVAILVALAVPVSQLRTVTIVKSCCCPDPSNCHCPDHKADSPQQPSMRACHNTERAIVSPELPAFRAPVIAIAQAPAVAIALVATPIAAPHPAPPPIRPAAPS